MVGPEQTPPSTPPSPEAVLPRGSAWRYEDGALRLALSTDVYGLDAIFRSCYRLTERCYVYLSPPHDGVVEVSLVAKDGGVHATDQLAWSFLNDLVDQRLRIDVNRETRTIREVIVAQAFAETDLIDDRGQPLAQSDQPTYPIPDNDPQRIQTWRAVP